MGKNEKTPITINGEEHNFEDLTEQQRAIVNHIADLDKKLGSLRFNMDQLNVGREAFINMLSTSLAGIPEDAG
tara:strand:- start:269 stop:487 length:219 start_codon:yes stop_codon:yes gene_type:complete